MISRKNAFFGIHFDLHPGLDDTELGADITEEMISGLLERVHPDFVQYDCKGHAGYTGYPARVGWPSPGIVKDSLAIWRKVTFAYDTKLFIHYSGVWDKVAVQHHPEWARVNEEDQPDGNGITSTFGPYVDDLLIPQLKEVFDAYQLDGAWVDGECWATLPDYCPAALAGWQAETGLADAPRKAGDVNWRRWLDFNRRQFERYLNHYLNTLHRHNPALEITSNWMYTAFTPKPVEAPVDFISGDFTAQDSVNTARFEARYIANTGLPWDLMAWGFSWWGDQRTQRAYKSAEMLKQEAAVVLGQGGGFQIYYNPTRAGWIEPALVEVMGDVADFCRVRQTASHKTESVPQVALLLSSESFYAQSNGVFRAWEGEFNPLKGTLHALLESGFSVDVLAEHQIAGRMAEYPVIVIPEVTTLTEDFRTELVEYAQGGGNLLLVGAQTARLFRAELDVQLEGEVEQRSDYLIVQPPDGPAQMGICGGDWQRITPNLAQVVGWRYPTHDGRKNGLPAATLQTIGQGRLAAVYGPLGTTHYDYHTPVVRTFLKGIVRLLFPRPLVEVEGPPCVDLAVRKKENQLLVHLANTAGMQVTSNYSMIDSIPTVGPLTVKIRLDQPPRCVGQVPEGSPVVYAWQEGVLTVRVDQLHIHMVLVINV